MPNKKKRPHGHYCKICGQHKANEQFSGKGHANHICKSCSSLPAAAKTEWQTMNRLLNMPMRRLTDSEKKWLENRVRDSRPEVAELARSVYNMHFPHAERNAMKKQLTINVLAYELHTEVYDGYGDIEPVNRLFTVDRKNRTITMKDYDSDGQEQTVTLDGGKMAKLLRWAVHTLEIFMWPQDYFLSPADNDPYLDELPDLELQEDFEQEADTDLESFLAEISLPEDTEPEGEPFWRVHVEYANHTAQDIPCYNETLPAPAEELYLALLEYFEVENEFEDDDMEFEKGQR